MMSSSIRLGRLAAALLAGLPLLAGAGCARLRPAGTPPPAAAGVDPYFFGLLFVLNVGIGVITPPVGTVLFVVCGSAGISMGHLVRKMAPFLLMEVAVLFLLLFFPKLSLVPLKWLM